MPGHKVGHAYVVGHLQLPYLVEQRAHGSPSPLQQQQVVALHDDQIVSRRDRHVPSNWLLDSPIERRWPNNSRRVTKFSQAGDEPLHVEGVRGTLDLGEPPAHQVGLGQVEAVHADHRSRVTSPPDGIEGVGQCYGQQRLANPRRTGEAEQEPWNTITSAGKRRNEVCRQLRRARMLHCLNVLNSVIKVPERKVPPIRRCDPSAW